MQDTILNVLAVWVLVCVHLEFATAKSIPTEEKEYSDQVKDLVGK